MRPTRNFRQCIAYCPPNETLSVWKPHFKIFFGFRLISLCPSLFYVYLIKLTKSHLLWPPTLQNFKTSLPPPPPSRNRNTRAVRLNSASVCFFPIECINFVLPWCNATLIDCKCKLSNYTLKWGKMKFMRHESKARVWRFASILCFRIFQRQKFVFVSYRL